MSAEWVCEDCYYWDDMILESKTGLPRKVTRGCVHSDISAKEQGIAGTYGTCRGFLEREHGEILDVWYEEGYLDPL